MRRSGDESILNIASIAGTIPAPVQAHYSSAKAAVIALTRAFAQDSDGGDHGQRRVTRTPLEGSDRRGVA